MQTSLRDIELYSYSFAYIFPLFVIKASERQNGAGTPLLPMLLPRRNGLPHLLPSPKLNKLRPLPFQLSLFIIRITIVNNFFHFPNRNSRMRHFFRRKRVGPDHRREEL